MKKLSLFLFIFFSAFFVTATSALAVNVTINNYPATISSGDAFQISVSVTGPNDGTNYLRADLFKEGTANYFGETYNGSYWLNSSDGLNYYPVQIQNSTGSATFLAKVGSPTISEFPGPGTYKLKIRRYTSKDSYATNDTGDPVTVQITYVAATSSPSPTPVPSATPSPIPTPTKTPTPVPTKSPTPKPTQTPQVLGENTTPTPAIDINQLRDSMSTTDTEPTEIPVANKKSSIIVLASIFIGVGVILTIVAGVLIFKKIKSEPPLG